MTTHTLQKRTLADTIDFAWQNIPGIDTKTLEMLLQLVDAEGSHGTISHARLQRKMQHVLKYVPHACARSLVVLADLLELSFVDRPAALQAPNTLDIPVISLAELLQATVVPE